jgi:hypothetical protein
MHVRPSIKKKHMWYAKIQMLLIIVCRSQGFMHVAKKGDAFLIYVLPMEGVELPHHEIPSYYKEFKDMFKRIMLTPSHNIAHMIAPLILGGNTTSIWTYLLAALREYTNENLEMGFIRHSKFPTDDFFFFVKKNDGFLHLCVNFYGLNWLTIKNQ